MRGCLECDRMRHHVRALTEENNSLRAAIGVVRRVVEDRTTAQPVDRLDIGDLERSAMIKALVATGGHRARAAKLLGVARSTLYEMINRHGYTDGRTRG